AVVAFVGLTALEVILRLLARVRVGIGAAATVAAATAPSVLRTVGRAGETVFRHGLGSLLVVHRVAPRKGPWRLEPGNAVSRTAGMQEQREASLPVPRNGLPGAVVRKTRPVKTGAKNSGGGRVLRQETKWIWAFFGLGVLLIVL